MGGRRALWLLRESWFCLGPKGASLSALEEGIKKRHLGVGWGNGDGVAVGTLSWGWLGQVIYAFMGRHGVAKAPRA